MSNLSKFLKKSSSVLLFRTNLCSIELFSLLSLSLSLFFLFVFSRCDYLSRRSVDERENERRRKVQIEGADILIGTRFAEHFFLVFFFSLADDSSRVDSVLHFFPFRGEKRKKPRAKREEKRRMFCFLSFLFLSFRVFYHSTTTGCRRLFSFP